MIGFNEDANRLNSLLMNQVYLFKTGIIRASKKCFRSWPNQERNSNYDIHLRSDTIIEMLANDDISKDSAQHISEASTSALVFKTPDAPGKSSDYDKGNLFTPIDQIIFKGENSSINVVGVLTKISAQEKIVDKYGKSLDLLNIYILDKTKTTIRIAFWGKQALRFSYKIGNILVFKDITVRKFNGISLSVNRNCVVSDLTGSNITAVRNLITWYETWSKLGEKPSFLDSDYSKKRNLNEYEKICEESPKKKLKK